MAIEPDFTAFSRAYDEGRPQAVYTRRIADLDTPVSAYLKLAEGRDNAFLLESVQGGETRGRYSIIGLKPDLIWRCRDGKAEINRNARGAPDIFEPADETARPLEVPASAVPRHADGVAAGICRRWPSVCSVIWVTTWCAPIERLGPPPPDTLGLPDAILLRPTITAIFDNVRDEITIVSPVWPEDGVDARTAYARACERVIDTIADLERPAPATPAHASTCRQASRSSPT